VFQCPADDIWQEKEASKAEMFFGPEVYDALREKIVIDFGCGCRMDLRWLALNGVERVIGIDIVEQNLENARG